MATSEQLIQEVWQAVLGIPDTGDKGLVGKVNELVELVRRQNTRVRKVEQKTALIWGVLIGLGATGVSGLGLGIKALLGD